MTPNNFFFTNKRLAVIYLIIGYVFLFGGTTIPQQKELTLMAVGASVFFLILALYHVMKEYGKEYQNAQIK